VSVEGELTIYRALELKRALLEPLESKNAVEIDLSRVTELDTSGVQLLLLAQRTAAAKELELRFVDPSPAVVEVLALLNVSASLGVGASVAPPRGAP
jgi:anti-anti-sigma factor